MIDRPRSQPAFVGRDRLAASTANIAFHANEFMLCCDDAHSDSLTPYEMFSKKTAVAYGADLLAFELNGEVVSGLPGHHSSE